MYVGRGQTFQYVQTVCDDYMRVIGVFITLDIYNFLVLGTF